MSQPLLHRRDWLIMMRSIARAVIGEVSEP